jgi:signal transduction histidine kinase
MANTSKRSEAELLADPAERAAAHALDVVRAIAHAGLAAHRAIEVYRAALARATPLLGATFSSVFLRADSDRELLRLVCAQNWPQASARWLGELRIRVGRGPTGRAVAARAPVEVGNVFADPELREWWEPARELGFTSLISLPLLSGGEVQGALTFYFAEARSFSDDERQLLGIVAEQIAVSAERAREYELIELERARLRWRIDELEARLADADDALLRKEQFLANASHEMRTPLTAISGYAYLLGSGHAGPLGEGQAGPVERIESAAGALLRMVDDLQELAELRLGRSRPDPEVADAVALARAAVDAAGAAPEGVTVRIAAPDGAVTLRTDGQRVLRVLGNLLSNAYKFTTRGEVTLAVRATARGTDARWVEWSVQDTGVGIRPEDLAAIFDELRQVDGSSTRLFAGTGLGLALSLAITRLLGGSLEVESDFGKGSRFTLRLPVAPPADF